MSVEPSELVAERRKLVDLAYRLLGSLADAEDAVSETYLRWYGLTEEQRDAVQSPIAWLMKSTGRVCLDMLGSARARREHYTGQWLPEPLPDTRRWHSNASAHPDPADSVTLDESVGMALLLILESMTPAERVAFVLHDVFQYPFTEISAILGRSAGACRQLAFSARRRVEADRPLSASTAERSALTTSFKHAWQTRDLRVLMTLFNPDITAITDGGGKVTAAAEPIYGREAVALFFIDVFQRQPDLRLEKTSVNGQPGLVAYAEGRVLAVISFGVIDGLIHHIWVMRNPDKLKLWE
ncbi:RNA polymerase sigma factor SigJ [Nocardia brevicatena]|uniref:RNA polymerase sigma factor SigJ n=1 Tax=Nocardia brevicatena TaxID=37327 RepID=UPI00031CDF39|nr:RNA polymerase sigma factor SigJ [Nocardia brevicatena]